MIPNKSGIENIFSDPFKDAFAAVNYEYYVSYTNPGYKHGKHTRFLARKMQEIEEKHARGIATFTIVCMPPRHSKSYTITETFPSWFIGKDKRRRVIQVSYGVALARKFGLANLRKMETIAGRIFDVQIDPRKAAATNWELAGHNGGMVSTGIGSAITGEGSDLLLIDDPIRNRKDANSKTYRDSLWSEWKSTLSTRLQPGGSVIVILTRWHEDDLAGRILKEDARDWEVIKMPAIAQENDILGREPGEPLWAENGFDKEWAEKTKLSAGAMDWASLYQQDPKPLQGALFKRSYWKFYEKMPAASSFERIIFSWDCTFKDLDTSDYVVGQVWGKRGADFYLLDQTRAKMGITATMRAIEALKSKWHTGIGVYVEDKANGTAVIEMLKNKISGINAVNPSGGKVDRAQAVAPVFEAGNVYLPDPKLAPWINDYMNEMAAFPVGEHDDQVDATTQAINILMTEKKIFIGRA